MIRHVSKYAGYVIAIAVAVMIVWFRGFIAAKFASDDWSLSAYYGAIFDWAAIQTGFLFGVYTYIVSKTDGFIRAVRQTSAYKEMVGFIRFLFYLALAITVVAIPLLVIQPAPTSDISLPTLVFAAWSGFVAFTFVSFVRIVRAFSALERARSE